MKSILVILLAIVFSTTPVVYYSQNDPRWGNTTLTCTNGTTNILADVGCGETVVAMLMSTYIDPRYTPDIVVEEIYGYEWCRGTGKTQNAQILKDQGFIVAPIAGEIDIYFWKDWNIVGYVPGHYILIVGMRNNEYAIYDPDHGIGFSGDDKFPYTKDDIILLYAVKYIPDYGRLKRV